MYVNHITNCIVKSQNKDSFIEIYPQNVCFLIDAKFPSKNAGIDFIHENSPSKTLNMVAIAQKATDSPI